MRIAAVIAAARNDRVASATATAATVSGARAMQVMHERHEGMEKIGKSKKSPASRARLRVARFGDGPRSPSTMIADLSRRPRPGSRQAPDPNVGKTGAKPEIWNEAGTISPPSSHEFPGAAPSVRCRREKRVT